MRQRSITLIITLAILLPGLIAGTIVGIYFVQTIHVPKHHGAALSGDRPASLHLVVAGQSVSLSTTAPQL